MDIPLKKYQSNGSKARGEIPTIKGDSCSVSRILLQSTMSSFAIPVSRLFEIRGVLFKSMCFGDAMEATVADFIVIGRESIRFGIAVGRGLSVVECVSIDFVGRTGLPVLVDSVAMDASILSMDRRFFLAACLLCFIRMYNSNT